MFFWILGGLIVFMGAHVLLGWLRNAQQRVGMRRWAPVALGACGLATAQCTAVVLGLAGEDLVFPIGYEPLGIVGLWLAAALLTAPVAHLLASQPGLVVTIGAGLLLAALAVALPAGWIAAAGLRPGISWHFELVAIGWVITAIGFVMALNLAFPNAERARSYRYSWRITAAGLLALSFLAGFALVTFSAGLQSQLASIHRDALPGSTLAAVLGVLVPLILGALIVDLERRRRQRRRHMRGAGGSRPRFGGSVEPSVQPPFAELEDADELPEAAELPPQGLDPEPGFAAAASAPEAARVAQQAMEQMGADPATTGTEAAAAGDAAPQPAPLPVATAEPRSH